MAKKTFTVAQRWVPRVHPMTSREWPTAVALLPSTWEAKAKACSSHATVLLSLLLWKGLGQGRGADLEAGGVLQWHGFSSLPNGVLGLPLQWLILPHQFGWATGCP